MSSNPNRSLQCTLQLQTNHISVCRAAIAKTNSPTCTARRAALFQHPVKAYGADPVLFADFVDQGYSPKNRAD